MSSSQLAVLVVPAVDDNGSSILNGALCAVDFLQEPEDAAGLVGDAMVRPAQVLVVPDVPQRLLLHKHSMTGSEEVLLEPVSFSSFKHVRTTFTVKETESHNNFTVIFMA